MSWTRHDFELARHSLPPDDHLDGLLGADFFAEMRLVIDHGVGIVELTASSS